MTDFWQLHQRIAAAVDKQRRAAALFFELTARFRPWR